jgi:hypothetical protein
MKGGVTSGVVYPPAICAIARAFDLHAIGGSSAGAVAAALAAAAQYRRLTDTAEPEAGFEVLESIPEWLGTGGHLFDLFAPNARTRDLFDAAIALGAPGRNVVQRVAGLLAAYPIPALIGGSAASIPFIAAGATASGPWRTLNRVLSAAGWMAGVAAGTLAGATLALAADVRGRVPSNGYGLITGVDDTKENADSLMLWLAAMTEEIAGLPAGETPLTFGMLWNPSAGAIANGVVDPPSDAQIDLKMITTGIVEGRPFLFPMRTNRYRFRVSEMVRYLPPHVVAWMVHHARASEHAYTYEGEALVPLPVIGDLPIVVATRMSLAFPLLLSAVPLYFITYAADGTGTPVRSWFSDGGLTSNFPIELFDAPLPRWPTLAINLGGFPPGAGVHTPDVVMTTDNQPDALYAANPVSGMSSFGTAIFDTMKDGSDLTLARLPGYRDRIVTIRLHPREGGLNLDMDARTVDALVDRGRRAGEMLVARFGAPSELERVVDDDVMSWENHRWIRYRTLMSELRALLARYEIAWYNPAPGDQPYDELVRATAPGTVPRRSYSFPNDPATRERLVALSEALAQLGEELSTETALVRNEPHPPAELATRARLDHS